jgi:hypothetical protein
MIDDLSIGWIIGALGHRIINGSLEHRGAAQCSTDDSMSQ